MKAIHILLLYALLVACQACTTPQPAPPSPPTPVPVVTGRFTITEFDANGRAIHTWNVSSFKETQFPRRVSFSDGTTTHTLTGSYQIDQSL